MDAQEKKNALATWLMAQYKAWAKKTLEREGIYPSEVTFAENFLKVGQSCWVTYTKAWKLPGPDKAKLIYDRLGPHVYDILEQEPPMPSDPFIRSVLDWYFDPKTTPEEKEKLQETYNFLVGDVEDEKRARVLVSAPMGA